MSKHVALLRSINLGSKNKIAMRDLVALFDEAGAADVRTYIQSGNVVFAATDAEKVGTRVCKLIETRLGLDVPIVIRSATELANVPKKNPFLARGEEKCHVMFLKDKPAKAAVAALDPNRSPGDEFAVVGRDLYLFLPNGVGRSKLTNGYFDRKLATTSTGRNWRTVKQLLEMLR